MNSQLRSWRPLAGHALRRIGANSAVFGVADALILPLPYPDPDRIAIIWQRSPGLNVAQDWLSLGQYADVAGGNTTFEHVAAAIGIVYVRLKPGVPLERAQAEMDVLAAQMKQQYPANSSWGPTPWS